LKNMIITLPEKVSFIIRELTKNGYEAYAVGGCVRDSILRRNPEDWDITTSASPFEVKRIFSHTVDTGIKHGTVTVLIGKEGFEVTTYRVDGEYEDNRHPKEVAFTTNLVEDLKRRDFTINAMAYNDEEGLVDVFGGLADIKEQRIRCVGSAVERFDEDALRILRAVRFSAQLGFEIEEETMEAIRLRAFNLKNISAERVRVELCKLLASSHPEKLITAYETGITSVVLPEFDAMMKTEQPNSHHIYNVGMHTMKALTSLKDRYEAHELAAECCYDKKKQLMLRITALLHDVAKPDIKVTYVESEGHFKDHAVLGSKLAKVILRRLKFDNETIDFVSHLIRYHDYRYGQTEEAMRYACYEIGIDMMDYLFEIQHIDLLAQNPVHTAELFKQLEHARDLFAHVRDTNQCVNLKMLAVNGTDLISSGFTPGKQLGEVLKNLLEEVLKDPSLNTRDQLLHIAQTKYLSNINYQLP